MIFNSCDNRLISYIWLYPPAPSMQHPALVVPFDGCMRCSMSDAARDFMEYAAGFDQLMQALDWQRARPSSARPRSRSPSLCSPVSDADCSIAAEPSPKRRRSRSPSPCSPCSKASDIDWRWCLFPDDEETAAPIAVANRQMPPPTPSTCPPQAATRRTSQADASTRPMSQVSASSTGPTPAPPLHTSTPPQVQLDWNDPKTIAIEKAVTFAYGVKFRDRGPCGPEECGVDQWRGQVWREKGQRWGNRGGRHREYYAKKYGGRG